VAAPPNVFKKSLSTMLAVSQSWVANGAMLQNRLWENAAKMGVLASYVNSSGDEASAASSRVNLAWDLWAREHDIIEDTRDGTRSEVNTLHAQELVNQLNTREGNDRWRVVPMADYN
jgi:hypothetical protein